MAAEIDRSVYNARYRALLFIVLAIAAITFFPALSNDFVAWDDPAFVMDNPVIKSISVENVVSMFSESFVGSYCPLVILSYSFEYKLFGLNPFFFHLTNYLLHLLCVYFAFIFINKLTNRPILALFTALIFAIHPVQVETVAWVSERKGLLSALFYLLSAIKYLDYINEKNFKNYLKVMGWLFLALLSKPIAVSVPLTFLLIDYYKGVRIDRNVIMEKMPFFVLSFLAVSVNWYTEAPEVLSYLDVRGYFLSKLTLFYLGKLLYPGKLAAMYPYTEITTQNIVQIKYNIIYTFLILEVVLFSTKYTKKIFFGFMFFLLNLLPIMKIIPTGTSFAADRYLYIPSIGIFYLIGLSIDNLLAWRGRYYKFLFPLVLLLCLLLVVVLGFFTRARCAVWKDSLTFYEKAVQDSPKSVDMYYNLGNAYVNSGDKKKAYQVFRALIKVIPEDATVYSELGAVVAEMGKKEEAIILVKKALKMELHNPFVHARLGQIYENSGNIKDAIAAYEKAIKLDSNFAEIFVNLGNIYVMIGDTDKAIKVYEEGIKRNPRSPELYNNLAPAYKRMGQDEKAIAVLKKAIELDPEKAACYYNLGMIYEEMGAKEEAIIAYKKTVEVDPKHADAWNNLGNMYSDIGMKSEAFASYKFAVEADPNNPGLYNNLGLIYRDMNMAEESIGAYEQAIKIDPRYYFAYLNLGDVYRDLGKYEEARSMYDEASNINEGDPALLVRWAELFAEMGDSESAVRHYERVDKSKDERLYVDLGNEYMKLGLADKATEAYGLAIKVKSDYIPAYLNMGNAFSLKKDPEQAIFYYKKVLELDPEDFAAQFNIGIESAKLGEIKDAIKYLLQASEKETLGGSVFFVVSELYLKEKDPVNSKKYCDLAIEKGYKIHPNYLEEVRRLAGEEGAYHMIIEGNDSKQ